MADMLLNDNPINTVIHVAAFVILWSGSIMLSISCRAHTSRYLLSVGDVSRWGDSSVVEVFILIHPHLRCSPRVPERRQMREGWGTEKMGRGVMEDMKRG